MILQISGYGNFATQVQMSNKIFRKKGKPLSIDEKWMVVQVFQQCSSERDHSTNVNTLDAHKRTANYTGIGRRQVVEIIKHFKETGGVPPSTLPGNRTVHQTNIPTAVEEQIRQLIFNRHLNGEICNANHIQDLLKEILKRDIPLRTIQNHLDRMGFSYSRTRKKTRSLREKLHVRQQRHSYIYHIRSLRNSGYKPLYLDESFLHHYHGDQFSWFSETAGDYLERPAGKGRRWCFIHAMLETGLIADACYIFEAKKSTGDYHNMFNAQHFQEWWINQLMPNLPKKTVLVIDRATFHLVPEEQITPAAMRKFELQDWLTEKQIPWEDHWLKPQLIEKVDASIDKTPIVQKFAEQKGHKVLLLPVHHPELNPIETIWAIVKNECGKLLRQGIQFKEVRKHLEIAFSHITAETCSGLYDKIRKKEDEYWLADIELESTDEYIT